MEYLLERLSTSKSTSPLIRSLVFNSLHLDTSLRKEVKIEAIAFTLAMVVTETTSKIVLDSI